MMVVQIKPPDDGPAGPIGAIRADVFEAASVSVLK